MLCLEPTVQCWMEVARVDIPCLFPNLKGKASGVSPSCMMLWAFYRWLLSGWGSPLYNFLWMPLMGRAELWKLMRSESSFRTSCPFQYYNRMWKQCPIETGCLFFLWERLHVAEATFLSLFLPPSQHSSLSPTNENKQMIVVNKSNSFFPYYPYGCRTQYICP